MKDPTQDTPYPPPQPGKDHERARKLAIEAAVSLSDDKCEHVVVLDLRGRSQVADYFVVATGASDRQMKSAAMNVAHIAHDLGVSLFRSNKDQPGQTWVLMDFVDVVVHIFEPAARAYYDLEVLWGDGPRVDWMAARGPARQPRPAGSTGARPPSAD